MVIATLAGEPLIFEALASADGQSLPPRAIHVVIDRSSDGVRSWIATICDRHPSAQVHVQPGVGLASGVSYGISLVDTPYVAFLDHDDVWLPRKQELQIERLHESRDIDAVTCLAQNVDRRTGRRGRPLRTTMFTATTFRIDAFTRFGMPDALASHYVWLYRWWAAAVAAGIRTDTIDYVGLHRQIHGGNSWITGQEQAKKELMAELRRLSAVKRGESD